MLSSILLKTLEEYANTEHLVDAPLIMSYVQETRDGSHPKILELRGIQEFYDKHTDEREVELLFAEHIVLDDNMALNIMCLSQLQRYFEELERLRGEDIPVYIRAVTHATQEKLKIIGVVGVVEAIPMYSDMTSCNTIPPTIHSVLLGIDGVWEKPDICGLKTSHMQESFYCDLFQRKLATIKRFLTEVELSDCDLVDMYKSKYTATIYVPKQQEDVEIDGLDDFLNQTLLKQYEDCIDKALEQGNKEEFLRLTEEYNKYKSRLN